ncbi:MAG: trypsin-like peptidase domain-containing protein [Lachnospiraceae bacterium]|nr:trypsin-like peptidase domain-containing protein [Lachnospiraceae bacterium]
MYNEENYNGNESDYRETVPEETSAAAQETSHAQESPAPEPQASHTEEASWREVPPTATAPKEQKKNSGKAGRTIALVLCCALVGGAAGAGGAYLMTNMSSSAAASTSTVLQGERTTTELTTETVDTGTEMTTAEVYAANVNSIVGITTTITTNYFGYETTSAASGSGIVYTSDGYILTNYHVIEDSSSITVTTYDGTVYDAELIGYDESNDIAVLKVDATDLSAAVFGDSDSLNVGDQVVAIGNPLGELTFSLTSGVVSALDRQVTLSTSVTMNLIQTDCAINSGNSGGALFNMYGEVIGITNAKYSSSSLGTSVDNIGFAIPINEVQSIIQSIIEDGVVSKPYIGVSVTDVGSELLSYGMPEGARVVSVTEGSAAEDAGLQENDIITKFGDTEITGSSDLVAAVKAMSVGETCTMSVYRSGETIELTITIGEQTSSALANESTGTTTEEGSSSEDSSSENDNQNSSQSNGQSGSQSNGQGNSQNNGQNNSQNNNPLGNSRR